MQQSRCLSAACLQAVTWLAAFVLILHYSSSVFPHGENEWSTYRIVRTNETVTEALTEISDVISVLYGENRGISEWPSAQLLGMKSKLIDLEKQTDLILRHYTEDDGIDLQNEEELYDNPTAGRTVSASQGLKTAIELVYHITAFQNREALLEDVHTGGVSAYMYRLLQAQREKMALYGRLIELNFKR